MKNFVRLEQGSTDDRTSSAFFQAPSMIQSLTTTIIIIADLELCQLKKVEGYWEGKEWMLVSDLADGINEGKGGMRLIRFILQMLFPPRCIFCSQVLRTGTGVEICGTCNPTLPWNNAFAKGMLLPSRTNGGCDAYFYVFEYSGKVKDALIRYKFYGRSSYARTFAALLSQRLKEMTNDKQFDIIISVPLHKSREAARGYNQSRLISNILHQELKIQEGSSLLSRIVDTKTQSLLKREERMFNIKDAFQVTDIKSVAGRNILLVDDIMTTGSTLDECSRTLKAAGARSVFAAIIAAAKKY